MQESGGGGGYCGTGVGAGNPGFYSDIEAVQQKEKTMRVKSTERPLAH